MAIGTTAAILGGTAALVGGSALASRSANKAANKQVAASKEAAQVQKEAGEQIRADLSPFREAGAKALPQLTGLVTDTRQQRKFIEKNPFFDALAGRATETVLQNAAAQGRVGTGGTAEALQKSLVLLGSDLLNQRITQSQNLAVLGQSAAAQQAQNTQATANQIGELALQRGNIGANEIATQGNIFQGAIGNLGQSAGLLANLCDIRAKENIKKVGHLDNGLPLYKFNYIGDNKTHINVLAQDVEQVFPEAVIEKEGYKYVKMEALLCR